MYEDWHLELWDTPMSSVKHLFMESLHDSSSGLQLELAEWADSRILGRWKVTFEHTVAYRNILEEYRLELWDRLSSTCDALGSTATVKDSPWIREFAKEPLLTLLNPPVQHYMIMTEDDVIEILTNSEPKVEAL